MSEKGSSFPVLRRIVTVILLAGIALTFLTVYYFIYLPQQRALFNARTFRVLNQMASNFQDRIENYGIVKKYNQVSKSSPDSIVPVSELDLLDTTNNKNDSSRNARFNKIFQQSFGKSISKVEEYRADVKLIRDSVQYNIYKKQAVAKIT